jgi:hypothetical protein
LLTPAELRRLRAVLSMNPTGHARKAGRKASTWNMPLVHAMALEKAFSARPITDRTAALRAVASIARSETDGPTKALILGQGDRSERGDAHRRDHLPAAAERARVEYRKRRTRLDQLADHIAQLLSAEPIPGPDGKGLWTSGEFDLGSMREWEAILFPPTTKPKP